jgi:hypothetical protein
MFTHLFHDLGRLCINIIEIRIAGPPIYNEERSVARYNRDDWLSITHEEEEIRSDKLLDIEMRSQQTQLPVGASGIAA